MTNNDNNLRKKIVMSPQEKKYSLMLSTLFSLRMFGLFIILPIFTLHAATLPDGNNLTLIGFALGAFGLLQVFLQIPYGIASDFFGRKKLIYIGLILFLLGSVVGIFADSVLQLTISRALQGAGAFSGVVSAFAADLIIPKHLTKAMAMIGSSIALMFAISLVAAPFLYGIISLNGIFAITAFLTLPAFLITYFLPETGLHKNNKQNILHLIKFVLTNKNLCLLNLGILLLSFLQTSFFISIPKLLQTAVNLDLQQHWRVYLPAIFLSLIFMIPPIILAETKNKMALVFRSNILLLAIINICLYLMLMFMQENLEFAFWKITGLVFLFFVAFNVLEATLPSLVAKHSDINTKGTAMGFYNTSQSLGIFLGGFFGGYLAQNFGISYIFVAGLIVAILWLAITFLAKQNFTSQH